MRRLDSGFFSRSVSFDGPFFTLKSGSVTECNLCGRRKKGRGWGICNANSLSLSRPAMQVTESNKGVSCVVMLQGPVKGEVR